VDRSSSHRPVLSVPTCSGWEAGWELKRAVPQVLLLAFLSTLARAAPLEGFGDATDAEIAEIRAGTYLEMFDENPTYNYNYKVADDIEQTYLSLEESRNDNVVTGMYSYVDPLVSIQHVPLTLLPSAGLPDHREVQCGRDGIH
jgi:hypothetical protein